MSDKVMFKRVGQSDSVNIDLNYSSGSFWKDVTTRFKKNKGAVFGGIMILVIIFMALFGPMMNEHEFDAVNTPHQNLPPKIGEIGGYEKGEFKYVDEAEGAEYWFGTDTLGRDLWTRTWEGTRISLFIAFVAVIIDMAIGIGYGMVSGYFGGWVDNIMQRFVEIINGIPTLITVTLLMLLFEPGLGSIITALILTGWIGMSRVARAQMLKLKEQEFILASRTLGSSDKEIIMKDVLPNVFGQLITMSMFSIPSAIFSEAFLSFVGLGVPVPFTSLGSLINEGYKSLIAHPYQIVFPAVVLGILMLSFNLLADGLRDAFDPKMLDR